MRRQNKILQIGLLFILNTLPYSVYANLATSISAKTLHFDYEEFDDLNNSLDHETGIIPGLNITVSYRRNQLQHHLTLEHYRGKVDYDGHLQNGSPHKTKTKQKIYDFNYQLRWKLTKNQSFSMYSKYSYHRWDRDILPNNGALGLFEIYSWQALEMGVTIQAINSGPHQLSTQFGWFKIHNANLEIDQTKDNFGKPQLTLKSPVGANASVAYRYKFAKKRLIGASIQGEYWRFKKSDSTRARASNGFSVRTYFEPKSTTKHMYIELKFIQEF